jgi:hypothetical protein
MPMRHLVQRKVVERVCRLKGKNLNLDIEWLLNMLALTGDTKGSSGRHQPNMPVAVHLEGANHRGDPDLRTAKVASMYLLFCSDIFLFN